MSRPRARILAFLVATLACGAAGSPRAQELPLPAPPAPADDTPEIAAARARLDQARAKRQAAYDALESLVMELEDDYVALTTGPDAAARRQELVLAMADSIPAAEARLATESAGGRPVSRATRRRALQEAFRDPVARATSVDPRLAAWLADGVADELSRREALAMIDADDVLGALGGLFKPARNWWEFWNEKLREGRPEVAAWRGAVAEYEAAGLALDRARHPERYGPRGQEAPAGMVIVPGGTYALGPDSGWDLDGKHDTRKVNLRAFALDRREVTRRLYALFVDAQPAEARTALLPRGWTLGEDGRADPGPGGDDLPVVYVDFDQAGRYAAWAGKRLPSEDEWEAAAAGVDGRVFPWGDAWAPNMANGAGLAEGPLPVESFPHSRSPAGCVDMSGNVWEWTATLDDGTVVDQLPDALVNVIIRGGAWNSDRDKLTTRYRWAAPGHDTFASPRYTMPIGFRCAQDLR